MRLLVILILQTYILSINGAEPIDSGMFYCSITDPEERIGYKIVVNCEFVWIKLLDMSYLVMESSTTTPLLINHGAMPAWNTELGIQARNFRRETVNLTKWIDVFLAKLRFFCFTTDD